MHIITTWPELAQIALPEAVKEELIKHLLEPFQNEVEAKAFWEASGTSLVIGEIPANAVDEYTDPLPEGYTISLVIANDSGGGTYYVTQEKPHGN